MKRIGLYSFVLLSIFLVGAGCHSQAQHATASSANPKTPKAPAALSFVSDDGKSTLASFHIGYAKRGAIRVEQNPNSMISNTMLQALKMSNDRSADSDTLLLFFYTQGAQIYADKGLAVVTQEGTKHPAIGFCLLKPATPTVPVEINLISGFEGYAGSYMGPTDKSTGLRIWAFPLPPAPSRLTVKGLGGFSHIEFDVK